ncbi:MAG: replication-relaxation family protein [Patescibacteria group bacterium]
MKITPELVTPKQLEILLLLYRFRFLNRIQIQKFLNHKSHTLITTWLKDLTDRQITNRIYSQTVGDINKPAIYYLGLKSRHILKNQKDCNPALLLRVYREKSSSQAFQEHWLFMADLYFCFLAITQKQNSELQFFTTTDLANFGYVPLPLPDAYILVKDKKESKRYFLEVIEETVPHFAIRKKIDQYVNYYKAGYWQNHVKHPFPKVFLIYPNQKVKNLLLRTIPEKLDKAEVDMSFFLGSKKEIKENGIQASTWETV